MLEASRDDFKLKLFSLMRSYPTFRMPEKERDATGDSYFDRLSRYKTAEVTDAIDCAVDSHPDRFPSVGQLIAIIRRMSTDRHASIRSATRTDMTEAERSEANEARSHLPVNPDHQSRYISAATSEAERMARTWEIEDFCSGRHPWDETPRNVGKDRFASLLAILKPFAERDMP